MKLVLVAVVIITAAFGATEPVAAKTLELAPATPWNLHYDTDSCVLRRAFGEGKQRTQLEMRRFEPSLRLQTTVISKVATASMGGIRFRFGPEGDWERVGSPSYVSFGEDYRGVIFGHNLVDVPLEDDAGPAAWSQFHIENDTSAMEAQAGARLEHLTIGGIFRNQLTLKTGPLEKPLLALNQCIDDLMVRWGIDAEAHKTRTRSALPVNGPAAARMISYPPKMMMANESALVNIRLDIDESGRVTECHIQMPLSDPEFEESSCADIQHAMEFDPALDKDGKPMKSYYVTAVRFQLNDG